LSSLAVAVVAALGRRCERSLVAAKVGAKLQDAVPRGGRGPARIATPGSVGAGS
jgi:hypothetical protein